MKEIIGRLFTNRIFAVEIIIATFFIAFLNLGSPVFVINVLNRYVGYGFDGTLITLTTGMLIAVFLQYGFRISRIKLIGNITFIPDIAISDEFLQKLIKVKAGALERLHQSQTNELVRGIQTIQAAYDPANVISILDAPFSLLYLAAVFFLSPLLGFITLFGILFMTITGFISVYKTKTISDNLQNVSLSHRSLVSSAIQGSDTVRVFNAKKFLSGIWAGQTRDITSYRLKLSEGKEHSQSVTITASTLMSVVLYAAGSYFVVQGDLTIGALIGANILSSRSYMNLVKLVQTGYLISQAQSVNANLKRFSNLPVETDSGTAIKNYNGKLSFRDLSFSYPGSTGPLFESLTLDIEPGSILMITGKNGAGKTTLARLMAGLLNPVRGEILVGGINLNQIALPWWRQQIMYMPQEPAFLNASIRENLTFIKPDIDNQELNRIISMADLRTFLDRTPSGVDTILSEGGKNLSLGIRRRLALARALVTDGSVIIFDEPIEGLDSTGTQAVINVLEYMRNKGKTIITLSHLPQMFKGESMILNLDRKPVPEILFKTNQPQSSDLPKRGNT